MYIDKYIISVIYSDSIWCFLIRYDSIMYSNTGILERILTRYELIWFNAIQLQAFGWEIMAKVLRLAISKGFIEFESDGWKIMYLRMYRLFF